MRQFFLWVCVFNLIAMLGAGADAAHPGLRRACIEPSLVSVPPSGTQEFKVILDPTLQAKAGAAGLQQAEAYVPAGVSWSVNGIAGGDDGVGHISPDGKYVAPANLPAQHEIHICATVPDAVNPLVRGTVVLGGLPIQYHSVGGWAEPIDKSSGRTSHFAYPHGIGLDGDGNLLIADEKMNRVMRFTADGQYLGLVGEEGQFFEPKIVAVDHTGRICVSDMHPSRPRLQIFDASGKFLFSFAPGGQETGLLRPHGIGFDPQDRLFVVDVDRLRVNAYNPKGEPLFHWGREGVAPGEFNAPHGLVVDQNGEVFVNNYFGPIQKFGADGAFVLSFSHGNPPKGPLYFHNITGDQWGNVYTSVRCEGGYAGAYLEDGSLISVAKYNNNGSFITGFPLSGKRSETSVAVGKDGRVYALFVSETEMGVECFEEGYDDSLRRKP